MEQTLTRDLRPARGDLATAVLILADRMSHAQMCAALARYAGHGEDAARLDRVTIRRSRALHRVVSALARGGVR